VPWLGRPVNLVFMAVLAVVALVAAIIALAENWDVNLQIATAAEKMSHHINASVAAAAVSIMGIMAGLLLLRLRTWIGGLVIGAVAVAFPLFYNAHYLRFDPLPPYMAHLVHQPDLQALAKRESRPVRLLEQNLLKNEDMLYGISSVAGYHPIQPKNYAETAASLGFDSDAFAQLFAVDFARTQAQKPPAHGDWDLISDYPDGPGGSRLWRRRAAAPYLKSNASLAVIDTTDISLTSASVSSIEDAIHFGRGDQYFARVSLADAEKYRLVEGAQPVEAVLQKWLPGEVRLRVKAAAPRERASALLPVADPAFPGWHAETSRGNALPVIAVNGVQRGVVLPPGEHTMRFVYAPYSFRLGLFVSLFTATLLLFYAFGTAIRRGQRLFKKTRKSIKRAQTGRHSTLAAQTGHV